MRGPLQVSYSTTPQQHHRQGQFILGGEQQRGMIISQQHHGQGQFIIGGEQQRGMIISEVGQQQSMMYTSPKPAGTYKSPVQDIMLSTLSPDITSKGLSSEQAKKIQVVTMPALKPGQDNISVGSLSGSVALFATGPRTSEMSDYPDSVSQQ